MGAVVIFDHGLKFSFIFLVFDHPAHKKLIASEKKFITIKKLVLEYGICLQKQFFLMEIKLRDSRRLSEKEKKFACSVRE